MAAHRQEHLLKKQNTTKKPLGNQLIATLIEYRVVRAYCVNGVGVSPSCERRADIKHASSVGRKVDRTGARQPSYSTRNK